MSSRVIINADDFGITKGVNRSIFELVDAGILTSTTVMANMPFHAEIVKLKHRIGIGMHFNLTVGKPVLGRKDIPSLVDEEGNFFDFPTLKRKIRGGAISKKEVEEEFEAQVKALSNLGITIDHFDSHESLLKYPFFYKIAKKTALKNRIPAVRTYVPRKFDYKRLMNPRKALISIFLIYQKSRWKRNGFYAADKHDSLLEFNLDYDTALKKLKTAFHNLPNGVLEFVVHPGYIDKDTSLLGKYVYEREVELKALSSNEFKKIIEDSRARLISFKDIYNK